MANDLQTIEKQLTLAKPSFTQALTGTGVAPERVIRTVLVSLERLPALQSCSLQSIMNAAMSAAVLGLEVDGTTGQAYLIPFKGQAQLVIGYKGFNTLAARSGFVIRSAVVREGDKFEWDPTAGAVHHNPKLGNQGKIIGAWALSVSNNLPSVAVALSIEELMAVKNKSPGAKRPDSPWNDPAIGFPAMCEKTVKRRLARSMPLNIMQLGAAMEEGFEERGVHTYIKDPDEGVVIEAVAEEVEPMGDREEEKEPAPVETFEEPEYVYVNGQGQEANKHDIVKYVAFIKKGLVQLRDDKAVQDFLARNAKYMLKIKDKHPKEIQGIEDECAQLIETFKEPAF